MQSLPEAVSVAAAGTRRTIPGPSFRRLTSAATRKPTEHTEHTEFSETASTQRKIPRTRIKEHPQVGFSKKTRWVSPPTPVGGYGFRTGSRRRQAADRSGTGGVLPVPCDLWALGKTGSRRGNAADNSRPEFPPTHVGGYGVPPVCVFCVLCGLLKKRRSRRRKAADRSRTGGCSACSVCSAGFQRVLCLLCGLL